MSGRVLVVDDLEPNRRLLEALLARDYCEVIFASTGLAALRAVSDAPPDLILLDWRLPDIDGLEVCRRLKAARESRDIPVVMVTAFNEREARLEALKAGADDFLSKPINALQLSARVRSLLRWKHSLDQMRRRHALGRSGPALDGVEVAQTGAAVALVDDPDSVAHATVSALANRHSLQVLTFPQVLDGVGDGCDVAIVHLGARSMDPLLAVARLQSRESSQRVQILCLAPPDHQDRAARALELGAHDIVVVPSDGDELLLRVTALVRRKRSMDLMQALLEESLEQAVTDPLTGLYNRRFLMGHLGPLLKRAEHGGAPVAVILFDLDYFKRINDQHGHDAGDAVLREFAARVAAQIRPTDFACRLGGEEFVVLLPGATLDYAILAAERLRLAIAGEPFLVRAGERVVVTTSAGVAAAETAPCGPERLLKIADQRLYAAKTAGRNRVAAA